MISPPTRSASRIDVSVLPTAVAPTMTRNGASILGDECGQRRREPVPNALLLRAGCHVTARRRVERHHELAAQGIRLDAAQQPVRSWLVPHAAPLVARFMGRNTDVVRREAPVPALHQEIHCQATGAGGRL